MTTAGLFTFGHEIELAELQRIILMSAVADVVKGFGQGSDTTTVLTDKAKNITVIADEPYFSRHSRTHESATRHIKGSLPMHRSTLILETCPIVPTSLSCMKMVSKFYVNEIVRI